MGPLNASMKATMLEEQGDVRFPVEWTSLGQYLEHLERKGVAVNVASFVGATTLRIHEVGYADRAPTDAELARMVALVDQAMAEGALGIGASLIYAPAFYARTDELIALARAAGRHGGSYIAHMRSEGNRLVEETAALGRGQRQSLFPDTSYYGSGDHLATARHQYGFAGDARPLTSPRYSVATEVQLRAGVDYPGVSDRRHFQRANRVLHERMMAAPEFAGMLEGLYPGLTQAIAPGARGAYPQTAPSAVGLTWHHEANRPGVLQLIPEAHHTAPGPVQQTLHPNGRGGMENWGGGRTQATPPPPVGPTLF